MKNTYVLFLVFILFLVSSCGGRSVNNLESTQSKAANLDQELEKVSRGVIKWPVDYRHYLLSAATDMSFDEYVKHLDRRTGGLFWNYIYLYNPSSASGVDGRELIIHQFEHYIIDKERGTNNKAKFTPGCGPDDIDELSVLFELEGEYHLCLLNNDGRIFFFDIHSGDTVEFKSRTLTDVFLWLEKNGYSEVATWKFHPIR